MLFQTVLIGLKLREKGGHLIILILAAAITNLVKANACPLALFY
jgi:hypothetical protein